MTAALPKEEAPRCEVCGREKWAYHGPARKPDNCTASYAWPPDLASLANLLEHWRLGYERSTAAHQKTLDALEAAKQAIVSGMNLLDFADPDEQYAYSVLQETLPGVRAALLAGGRNV